MDLSTIISALQQELERIDDAIQSLERLERQRSRTSTRNGKIPGVKEGPSRPAQYMVAGQDLP